MENRKIIVEKAIKKMGLIEALEGIKKLSNCKYRVTLCGPIYNCFVYKTKSAMKENYNIMIPVDDYFVYIQDYIER